jgi:hypothetical protein
MEDIDYAYFHRPYMTRDASRSGNDVRTILKRNKQYDLLLETDDKCHECLFNGW